MHSLEKKIRSIITEKKLFKKADVVLVGVSAGPDSTALLLVLSALQDLGFTLMAMYVDHGLRPCETPAEKEFLAQLCADLQVPLTIESVDVGRQMTSGKESLEQAARKLRYQAFSREAQRSGANKIAVGHTADDQAEEVVLRLLRGTARAGLSGMKLMRDDLIVRPLLQSTKAELYQYLQEKAVSFVTDSSNESTIHLRNQVRLEILPFLRRYNPSIDGNLRNLALILQDEEDFIHKQVEEVWQELVVVAPDGSKVEWSCAGFLLLHVAMQRRIAEKMFITMKSVPSADKIKQLLYLITHGQGGSQLHFAHGLRVLKKKGNMFFWYPQGRTSVKGNLFADV